MGKTARIAALGYNCGELWGKTQTEMIEYTKLRLSQVRGYKPDLICLPETFLDSAGDGENPRWAENNAQMLDILRENARAARCYLSGTLNTPCPSRPGLRHNTAFLIDRNGEIALTYRKIHPTDGEMDGGTVPGDVSEVVETDFGRVGLLICFDVGWRDEWTALKRKGAELVIWSSAYDGGQLLNFHAAHNMYFLAASVWSETPRIVDPAGRSLREGTRWDPVALADVNLGARLYHIDRQFQKIDDVRRALGDRVKIYGYSQENVFILSSSDPDWPLERIDREFGLINYEDYHAQAERLQDEWRERYSE